MNDQKFIEVKPKNYVEAVDNNTDFYIQFIKLNKFSEPLLYKAIRRFLSKYEMLYLKDTIITMLKEIISNSSKANAKRLYFNKHNLDINDANDYKKGMQNFKKDVINPKTTIFDEMENTSYRVRVIFNHNQGTPVLKIKSNAPIVNQELDMIKQKIKLAYSFNDITEAFTTMLDNSEGAGLGLIMAIMLLKNSGFSKESFKILTGKDSTTTLIELNRRNDFVKYKMEISDKISNELESLPAIPDIINQITALCDNKETKLSELTNITKKDPGLVSNILKTANSALYGSRERINSIEKSIKLIGLKGLKAFTITEGVNAIIHKRYPKFKTVWNNSNKKAFYAYKIAIQLKNNSISDDAYLSALLSDLGSIILLSINQDQTEQIIKFAGIKEITNIEILEESTLGISHNVLGAMITRKWGFDESLSAAIEFHLKPYMVSDEFKELTYIVYLSHVFQEMNEDKFRYELIDDEVLKYFRLNDHDELNKLYNILTDAYNLQNTI